MACESLVTGSQPGSSNSRECALLKKFGAPNTTCYYDPEGGVCALKDYIVAEQRLELAMNPLNAQTELIG
jgi:hypothetical protein